MPIIRELEVYVVLHRVTVLHCTVAYCQGGFMLVRFNNEDGSHGYEMIDFRETMPAAGNETVRISPGRGYTSNNRRCTRSTG
jgi:hypothetical protein